MLRNRGWPDRSACRVIPAREGSLLLDLHSLAGVRQGQNEMHGSKPRSVKFRYASEIELDRLLCFSVDQQSETADLLAFLTTRRTTSCSSVAPIPRFSCRRSTASRANKATGCSGYLPAPFSITRGASLVLMPVMHQA